MVMAQTYTIVGEYDKAIDGLEYLMTIPAWVTPQLLTGDPLYKPLWDLPRFKALIEKYK